MIERHNAALWPLHIVTLGFGVAIAGLLRRPAARRGPRRRAWSGWGSVAGAAIPVATGPLGGRGWLQAEVVGIMPDPTAVATLGVLLLAETPAVGGLLVAPILWCLVSGATLWAMGSPEAWLPLSAAGVATAAFAWYRSPGQP